LRSASARLDHLAHEARGVTLAAHESLIQRSPVEARFAGSMTFADWAQAGCRLAHISHGVAWALGDWLNYGRERFGGRYREAVATTALDYQTLRNYAWVARSVPVERRRACLSFQHHAEIASLAEAEQELWLGRAERLRWSRNQLRKEISSRHRCVLEAEEEQVVVRIALAAQREARWRRAAHRSALDLEEWLAHAADLAADAILDAPDPADGLRR
jgi:hypothetical protein